MSENADKKLGVRIRMLRSAKGRSYTQQWLADAVGMSLKRINQIENGTKGSISFSGAVAIAQALSVSIRDLVDDIPTPKSPTEEMTFLSALRFISEVYEDYERLKALVEKHAHVPKPVMEALRLHDGTAWDSVERILKKSYSKPDRSKANKDHS